MNHFPRFHHLPILLLLALAALPAGAAMGRAELSDAVARLQYAWYTRDLGTLVDLSGQLESERPRGDVEQWLRYYAAYGYYRAAFLADEDYLGEYVDRCEKNLRLAMKPHGEFAEALILSAGCAALLAERRPIAAVLAPSRALRAFRKAQRLDPENPRLLLQEATASVGRRALADELPDPAALLAEALRLFARPGAADELQPDWGEPEALLLLGRLSLDTGDRLRARDAVEGALQIIPDYADAKDLLGDIRSAAGR